MKVLLWLEAVGLAMLLFGGPAFAAAPGESSDVATTSDQMVNRYDDAFGAQTQGAYGGSLGGDMGPDAYDPVAPSQDPAVHSRPAAARRHLSADEARLAFRIPFLFEKNSAIFTAGDVTLAGELLKAMQMRPSMRIAVAGHTDASGPATYNLDLSQRRANSVKDYLTSNGIEAGRISAAGFGFTRLALPEQPYAAANRRVTIHFEH